MKPSRFALALFAAAVVAGSAVHLRAQSIPSVAVTGEPPAKVASPMYGAWGYDDAGRDPTVQPGVDFFRYANGAWYAHEVIPADRTRYGMVDRLIDLSDDRTRVLIELAAIGGSDDPDAAKVGDAYKAFLDEARANRLDAAPLRLELKAIADEQSRGDAAAAMGRAIASLGSSVFSLKIAPDAEYSHAYAVYMDAASLGLPDRDYYLDPKFAEKKAAYLAYVAQMLKAINWPSPNENAQAILAFETALARVGADAGQDWSRTDERDPNQTYEPMPTASLARLAPEFDFPTFFESAGVGGRQTVMVRSKTAFPRVAAILAATPLETLRAWQAYHLADNAAPLLSDRFVQARFAFRKRVLTGQLQIQPRWQRATEFVNGVLGDAVGRMYVARYFPPQAKAKMEDLVSNLRLALRDRIQRVDWMSAETKARALEKLSKLTVKIGYPTEWRDYGDLQIRPDDLYGDARRATAFEWRRQVKRLDQPVDKLEWDMTPQTVNAYYSMLGNEVVLPAAMLQPPFFDPDADPAVNYGGIGCVIGHEMTHGFDDLGGEYDGDGRRVGWWLPADADRFNARAKSLGAQYDTFEPLPGEHVKGELTVGENIADLGGVLVALDAYHASLGGKPAPVIDGLTGDQRFFLGFAQIWREKFRDDYERQLIASDPHSPSHYRVVGVLRNVDGWYRAFDIKGAEPMYLPPEKRVRLW